MIFFKSPNTTVLPLAPLALLPGTHLAPKAQVQAGLVSADLQGMT